MRTGGGEPAAGKRLPAEKSTAEGSTAEKPAGEKKPRVLTGHASVAEHAVLNFDVTGLSRLAVEEIEHFRLASFTEKSQRYIRLGRDLVVPPEIRRTAAERPFRRVVERLCVRYEETYRALIGAGMEAGAAKEDARYLMPLATATQFGMTANARELEYMIMRLAAHPLAELRSLSRALYRASKSVVPSLIRYPTPTEHWGAMPQARREIGSYARGRRPAPWTGRPATLAAATPGAGRPGGTAAIGGTPVPVTSCRAVGQTRSWTRRTAGGRSGRRVYVRRL